MPRTGVSAFAVAVRPRVVQRDLSKWAPHAERLLPMAEALAGLGMPTG